MIKAFIKSICAGVLIGLAGYVYLRCDNSFLGAFLFSVGLLSILIFKCHLLTGKLCYMDNYTKPVSLIMCFIGNLIGAACISFITFYTSNAHEKAVMLMTSKFAKTEPSLILDGAICGIFIAVAVIGYKTAEGFGKQLIVVLGVMGFILCGSEHVVADCYYAVSAHAGSLTENIRVICLVLLGNTLGGCLSSFITGEFFGDNN